MKHWLGRTPRTVGDWLGLALGTALIFGGVAQLPALAAALGRLAVMLRPFLWGLVLAYVLDIPTRWLAAKWFGGRRGAGAAVSYALLFGAAGLLLWLILPQLAQSVTSLFGKLAAYEETLRRLLAWVQATFGVDTATMDAILQQLTARLQSEFAVWSGRAAQAAAKAASNTAGAAADAGIALAASIYLLLGKEKLLHSVRLCLRAALPSRTVGQLVAVFQLADRTFSGYIGGQLVDALLVGTETFALMLLLRLDYAPLIAVMVGATNIVPVLGPFLGAVPGFLLSSPLQSAEFLIIILAVQQIDGNFIAPRILGGATGLSGLGVLLAIVVGGELFGIPGMVAGVPTLAVLAALARQAVGAGLTARGLPEEPPPAPQKKTVTKKEKN